MVIRLTLIACLVTATVLAQAGMPSEWVLKTDVHGNILYQSVTLKVDGNNLSGDVDGDKLEGTRNGNAIHFVVKDTRNHTQSYDGTLNGNSISGTAIFTHTAPAANTSHEFTARSVPTRPAGPPQRHRFSPTHFYNQFSADIEPVLTILPGDTVETVTIDSGGIDEHGVTRALYGNPQTGPFFAGTARQGDTLAVHINRLRLNRGYADSLDTIVGRALNPRVAARARDLGNSVRWTLDTKRGVAFPENASVGLKNFTAPLRPMLGCVGVAPGFGYAPFSTGDSGRFGGNMDVNDIVEGTTVYLEVEQPGALLYIGDAHAAQGDGETTQYALETSMDVEFSVDVIHGKHITTPRVETPTQIIAVGLTGSLDEALRFATAGLIEWLEQDYNLTVSEIAQVLGSSVQYQVTEIADRNVGVAAKLNKDRLAGLTTSKK